MKIAFFIGCLKTENQKSFEKSKIKMNHKIILGFAFFKIVYLFFDLIFSSEKSCV